MSATSQRLMLAEVLINGSLGTIKRDKPVDLSDEGTRRKKNARKGVGKRGDEGV